MRGIAILLLIIIFFWLIWPMIARWLKRKAMERAEDYMRSSMGMPPRDKKQKFSQKNSEESAYSRYYRSRNTHSDYNHSQPIIPKEYAEDVEFTELKDYSSNSHLETEGKTRENSYHESQISDVEFTEIKKPRTK